MIYNFQSQVISTPIEMAQQKLKVHQEIGTLSKLSIYEVASLMDTLIFGARNEEQKVKNTFQICFN